MSSQTFSSATIMGASLHRRSLPACAPHSAGTTQRREFASGAANRFPVSGARTTDPLVETQFHGGLGNVGEQSFGEANGLLSRCSQSDQHIATAHLTGHDSKPDDVRGEETIIGPVDDASLEIVSRKFSTLGDLERENHLEPQSE